METITKGKIQTEEQFLQQGQRQQEREEDVEKTLEVSKYAGRIKFYLQNWKLITKNTTILSWIVGYKIPFKAKPYQFSIPNMPKLQKRETKLYSESIRHLLKIGAVEVVTKCKNQFLSSFFLRQKPNGEYRFILNLKNLNKFITAPHFKLEDIRTAKNLIFQNCFLASIDLKDAYFLTPIFIEHKKYLRFMFENIIYEFQCLPFGLCTAPYTFTKMLKPVFSHLRSKGFLSVVYLDDFLLINKDSQSCIQNVKETIKLLESLGFFINTEKSQLCPSQKIKFLGFNLNTKHMIFSATRERKHKAISLVKGLLSKRKVKIRKFSQVIGTLASICPAVKYGWIYLKALEREKFLALKKNNGMYSRIMYIASYLKKDLFWWLNQIEGSNQNIKAPDYNLVIYSDASKSGWGACCNNQDAKGFWHQREEDEHINVLELKAAFYGLKTFAKHLKDCSILLKIDNKTAISVINKMGSIKYRKLNSAGKSLWQWCEQRHIFVFATYINTLENISADKNSRSKNIDTEFSLDNSAFVDITLALGKPKIDLFATYSNTKCEKFVSWLPDPESVAVDAFTLNWRGLDAYIFPPFSLMSKILSKIESDHATCLVIYPIWKSQPWYPKLQSMIVSDVLILQPRINLLLSPFRKPHPIWKHLTLGAAILSRSHTENKTFQKTPWT